MVRPFLFDTECPIALFFAICDVQIFLLLLGYALFEERVMGDQSFPSMMEVEAFPR